DDDDEDEDDYSSSCDPKGRSSNRNQMSRNGGNGFHFDYPGLNLRGSRTNCKGHWSKEEVSIEKTMLIWK
ncbi:MAG: hypothetical protein ACK55I_17030, partial [bacterium]